MNFYRLLYRSWFYFRTGYGTYIALPMGVASTLVVLYELAIKNIGYLKGIFPSLTVFTIVVLLVFIPTGILAGLYHMKRTGAYAADASVTTESNPYIYKVVPGKEQEVLYPLIMITARGLTKLLEERDSFSEQERLELNNVLGKAEALLKGQPVGLRRGVSTSELTSDVGDGR